MFHMCILYYSEYYPAATIDLWKEQERIRKPWIYYYDLWAARKYA